MKRVPVFLVLLCAAVSAFAVTPGRQLEKANVLPLALDGHFQFCKTKLFLNDPATFVVTIDPTINFERQRIDFKAVTAVDRNQRLGNYFTFFWRATKKADLTLRLEYQQAKLGKYVMAKEIDYPNFKGSKQSDFAVIGDDFTGFGRVTAWRAVLIENNRIVALSQSFLWD